MILKFSSVYAYVITFLNALEIQNIYLKES